MNYFLKAIASNPVLKVAATQIIAIGAAAADQALQQSPAYTSVTYAGVLSIVHIALSGIVTNQLKQINAQQTDAPSK